MPPKRNYHTFFERARINGSDENCLAINGEKVKHMIDPTTKKGYKEVWETWKELVFPIPFIIFC